MTRTLNDLLEFDHVVIVAEDGTVSDTPRDVDAPSLYDGELDDASWSMLDGYSGQDRYSGPIMHNSEFVGEGCRMERDILALNDPANGQSIAQQQAALDNGGK